MRIALGLAYDTALICIFAAIGRRSHAETGALLSVLTTAWPFLAGMAAFWLISLLTLRRAPLTVRDGIPVWLCAVTIGMAIDGGTRHFKWQTRRGIGINAGHHKSRASQQGTDQASYLAESEYRNIFQFGSHLFVS